jgi:peptidoglycan/LPS O-acetylase OafA/YrhL
VAGAVPATAAHSSYSRGVVWFAHVVRGLAAIVIIWGHLVVEFQNQALVSSIVFTDPIEGLPSNFTLDIYHWFEDNFSINLGNAAVGVFFMVSGFVIPFSLERRTMGGFAIRRFLRFYPTLWVALGLSILFVYLQTRHTYTTGQITGSMTLFSQYAGERWIDPSYWTLPIEELFYVSAAILAVSGLLTKRTAIIGACAVLAGISIFVGRVTLAPGELPDWIFWTRFWVGRNAAFVIFVFVGVALHHTYRGLWSKLDFAWVTAAIMGLGFIAFRHGSFMPPYQPGNQASVYFNSYALGLGLFVLAYILGDRIPKSKILDKLADMSYPIYLLNTVCGWILLVFLIEQFDNYYLGLVLTTAAVLLMAWLVHKFVEMPSMILARSISGRDRFRTDRQLYPTPEPPSLLDAEAEGKEMELFEAADAPETEPEPAPVGATPPSTGDGVFNELDELEQRLARLERPDDD